MAKRAVKVDTTYNGWTNYETWAVSLWIDNEEGSYRYWRDEAVPECRENAKERKARTGRDNPTYELADRLKSEITEAAPDLGATLWSDLLSAALSDVNWHEIAQHLLEE